MYESKVVSLVLFFVSMMSLNLFKTIFLNNFPNTESKLMDLYEVTVLGGLPSLSMSIMMDNF